MDYTILYFLGMVVATESITQLVIKSTIFKPLRDLISRLGHWPEELFKCGYCFSVWVALGITLLSGFSVFPTTNGLVGLFVTTMIIQRLSNILHNVIDKWTDKYYDLQYINTDKEGAIE